MSVLNGKNSRQASEVNLTVGWKVFATKASSYCCLLQARASGCRRVFERGDSCHYLLQLIADVCEEHSVLQSRTE